jgi:hypothetical protein
LGLAVLLKSEALPQLLLQRLYDRALVTLKDNGSEEWSFVDVALSRDFIVMPPIT